MYEYIKNFMGMNPYDYFCGKAAEESNEESKEEESETKEQ